MFTLYFFFSWGMMFWEVSRITVIWNRFSLVFIFIGINRLLRLGIYARVYRQFYLGFWGDKFFFVRFLWGQFWEFFVCGWGQRDRFFGVVGGFVKFFMILQQDYCGFELYYGFCFGFFFFIRFVGFGAVVCIFVQGVGVIFCFVGSRSLVFVG